MILVEVFVPAIEKTYEFEIDEHADIVSVVEGLAALVGSKTGRPWAADTLPLLCCQDTGVILPMQQSAYQCKVKPGNRLILV